MYVHGGAIHDPRDPMIGFHAMPVVSGGISPNRFPLRSKSEVMTIGPSYLLY